MVKVLFFIGTLNLDGASTWLHALVKNLDRDKFEPSVCIFIRAADKPRVKSMVGEINCEVKELNAPHHKVAPVAFLRLFTYIQKISPDLIVTTNVQLAFLLRFFAKILNIPIISVHQNVFNEYKAIAKLLDRATIKLSNKVVCVSEGVVQSYQGIVDENSMLAINNAAEIGNNFITPLEKKSLHDELGILKTDTVYLCAARLHPQKNHKELIHAFSKFVNVYGSEKKLLLAGWGTLYTELSNLIDSLNMKNNILLLGGRDDVLKLYQVASFFILSSLHEGLPLALSEAMQFGLPVLLTDLSVYKNVVEDRNSFIAKGFDRGNLYELLEKSQIIDAEKYQLMSESSKEIAKQKLSAANMARQYEAEFDKVLLKQ